MLGLASAKNKNRTTLRQSGGRDRVAFRVADWRYARHIALLFSAMRKISRQQFSPCLHSIDEISSIVLVMSSHINIDSVVLLLSYVNVSRLLPPYPTLDCILSRQAICHASPQSESSYPICFCFFGSASHEMRLNATNLQAVFLTMTSVWSAFLTIEGFLLPRPWRSSTRIFSTYSRMLGVPPAKSNILFS